MSIYYIEFINQNSRREIYSFDSTASITLDDNGSTTKFKLDSGEDVTDHYINNNKMISFQGTITDIKTQERFSDEEQNKTTEEFNNGMFFLKRSGRPFTIYTSKAMGIFNNCVFRSLSLTQDKTRGTYVTPQGTETSAFKISFRAEQNRFTTPVQFTTLREELIQPTTEIERPAASRKQEVDNERKLSEWEKFNRAISGRPNQVVR